MNFHHFSPHRTHRWHIWVTSPHAKTSPCLIGFYCPEGTGARDDLKRRPWTHRVGKTVSGIIFDMFFLGHNLDPPNLAANDWTNFSDDGSTSRPMKWLEENHFFLQSWCHKFLRNKRHPSSHHKPRQKHPKSIETTSLHRDRFSVKRNTCSSGQFQVPSNGKSISINILSISVDRGRSMFLLCCQTGMPRRALLQGVVCIDKRNFYLSQKARLPVV